MIVVGYDHQYDLIALVASPCPVCGRKTRPLYRAHKKLTLYWIPTFTLTHLYALKCECSPDRHWEVDEATAQRLLRSGKAPRPAGETTAAAPPTASPRTSTPGSPAPTPSSPPVVHASPAAAGHRTATGLPAVCARCGGGLAEAARFCHACGTRVQPRGRRPSGRGAPTPPAGHRAG